MSTTQALPLYERRSTDYGGRGLFALADIPAGTLVHSCLPYANVIFRSYRKDLCAWCFAYALGGARPKLVRHVPSSVDPSNGANSGDTTARRPNPELAAVWVCADPSFDCKEKWDRQVNVGGRFAAANARLEQALQVLSRIRTQNTNEERPAARRSKAETDAAWDEAAAVPWKKLKVEELTELEIDTARFVLSALVRRATESQTFSATTEGETWRDVVELEDTEALRPPDVLPSNLMVFRFLRRALGDTGEVQVSAEGVRAVLSREHSNVFGLFAADEDGGEMLGFSMYVTGSYFNHNCTPNIRKQRVGREMRFYASRDITAGEELCTNYVDVEGEAGTLAQRREALKPWFFECSCERCKRELAQRHATAD